MGLSMARTAEWQVDIVHEFVEASDASVELDQAIATLIQPVQELQDYVWRRHLVAAENRRFGVATAAEVDTQAVGFAESSVSPASAAASTASN